VLLSACESILRENDLEEEKINTIISEYSKFKTNDDFSSDAIHSKKTKSKMN